VDRHRSEPVEVSPEEQRMKIHNVVRRAVTGGIGAALVVGISVLAGPSAAHASSVGGSITRNEILARAQYWVNAGYVYSPNAPSSYSYDDDAYGTSYRDDCSGLVSEAWHLSKSYVTGDFQDGVAPYTTLGSLDDLLPGDAIVRTGHMELFAFWKSGSDHSLGAYVYSFNSNNYTVENPYANNNVGVLGFDSWSDLTSYAPIRYSHVIDDSSSTAGIYGVNANNTMTFTRINVPLGNRTGPVTSTATLPFTPVAIATMDFNTVLLTDANGALWRVDISTNSNSLVWSAITEIETSGFDESLLSYDGGGHLFGLTSAGHLLRWDVTATKPGAADISTATDVGGGFTLKAMTTTGTNRLVTVTTAGALRAYTISAAGTWTGATLIASGWGSMNALLSPGAGVYYGRSGSGLYRYQDLNYTDGSGADVVYFGTDPVDASGWTQSLLSAQPNSAS
jgi:hypothetical protein